jgi:hypothetical protein
VIRYLIIIIIAVISAAAGLWLFVENKPQQREQEIMVFGSYEGKELEWLVLAEVEGKMLLITKDCASRARYNEEYVGITWEECTLRQWLNDDFFNESFKDEEKTRIIESSVTHSDNACYGTPGGNDTMDRVFLLSFEEVKQYLMNDEVQAKLNGEPFWWWLRSPGTGSDDAAYVDTYGYVPGYGHVNGGAGGVRPALWINLESAI